MKLANAREAEVLALWSGLGYYSRARRLLEAARVVARQHHGRVPDDPETFGSLPGVGRYTTGAVLSIAFDRSLPVVDGNVARVLSRLFALRATVRDPRGARELWRLAARLVPMRGAGQWNQALMELGALVCLPRSPRCEECPVRVACVALATGRVRELPPAPVKHPTARVRQAMVVIERDGALLMGRRTGRLLSGMWEPPTVEIEVDGEGARGAAAADPARGAGEARDARRAISATRQPAGQRATARRLVRELDRLGVRARLEPTGLRVRHTITFRRIEVELWRGTIAARARSNGAGANGARLRFVDPRAPRVAITGLARKIGRLMAGRDEKRGGGRR